ncbi:MAG: hypothetical protein ACXIUM_04600 [Wenzhouxiangella sp.]
MHTNQRIGFRLACLGLGLGVLSFAAHGRVDSAEQVWQAHSGDMELEIRGDFLPDFGVQIEHHGQPVTRRQRISFQVETLEPFQLLVPFGNLEALDPTVGLARLRTGLSLRHGDRVVNLDTLTLTSGAWRKHPAFVARDAQGRPMLTLTHMHILAEHQRGLLTVQNAEVEASGELAALLGLDVLADMPIGLGWLNLDMPVPLGADTSGQAPGCDARPIWPQDGQFEAEVALIAMDHVVSQGLEPGTGRVKIAPSATLKNISLADVPWFPQFSNPAIYPYQPRDQHPFLVWNLYRIMDGRIEMLAESGVKHAFLTINQNCDINCGNSNILWPGCEDVYSAGNNDMPFYQGPKNEIVASLGLWSNCPSFFRPGPCSPPGGQTGNSGEWLNRLLVNPAEFQQPGASYFLDAWYVVQYDRNIWSTMGYRQVTPTPAGQGWTFNPGPFRQGALIREWVDESNPGPMADHRQIVVPSTTPDLPYPQNMPQGHLRLLVRVSETAPGRYRYNYALQNYDFDRGLDRFHIPLPPDAQVFASHFGGGPDAAAWTPQTGRNGVSFIPPAGEVQPWFTLYNFEIETDVAPTQTSIRLGLAGHAVVDRMEVEILGPDPGPVIFADRLQDE